MTDAMRSGAPSRQGWGWLLAYGVLLCVLGIIALLWPFPATLAATLAAGALLILSGIGALAAAARHHGTRRAYDVITGVLGITAGILIAIWPLSGALTLTLMLAIWLAARGAVELYFGVRQRGRLWLVALGLLNVVLAAIILFTLPLSALLVPGTLLGITFVMSGAAAIAQAMQGRSAASGAHA